MERKWRAGKFWPPFQDPPPPHNLLKTKSTSDGNFNRSDGPYPRANLFSPPRERRKPPSNPLLIGLEAPGCPRSIQSPPIVRLMSFPLSTSGPAARFMGSSKWGPSASGRAFPPKKIIRCGLASIHRRRLIIPPLFCLKLFVRSWWGTLPARNKCVAGRGAVTRVNE